MEENNTELRVKQMMLELELRQEEYRRTPEYRRERFKERLQNYFCIISIIAILGFFIGSAIAGNIESKRPVLADKTYETAVLASDCYLCGDNPDSPMAPFWGQANLGLLNLNTMDFLVLELNRYDENGEWLQTLDRYSHHRGHFGDKDAGSTANYDLYRNRGYMALSLSLNDNSTLNIANLKGRFCTDCCTSIINSYRYDEKHWDTALVSFEERKIYVLENNGTTSWSRGDYHLSFDYREAVDNLHIKGFYIPNRFSELGYDENETVLEQIVSRCQENGIVIDLNDELTEFIAAFESIHNISYSSSYIEFSEWTDSYKSLFISADGSYQIYTH